MKVQDIAQAMVVVLAVAGTSQLAAAEATKMLSSQEFTELKFEIVKSKKLSGKRVELKIANKSEHDLVIKGNLPKNPFMIEQKWDEKTQQWKAIKKSASLMKAGQRLIQQNGTFTIIVPDLPIVEPMPRYRIGLFVGYSPAQKELSSVPQENRPLKMGWVYFEADPAQWNPAPKIAPPVPAAPLETEPTAAANSTPVAPTAPVTTEPAAPVAPQPPTSNAN